MRKQAYVNRWGEREKKKLCLTKCAECMGSILIWNIPNCFGQDRHTH